ncbi:hypothetical protein GS482_21295 [Rhodococcus hoagii]|nr:hypothetical protein [Prescottella equi]
MSYSKFREKWFPRPDPRTPVTPEAIEHIEDGVARAHQAIDGRLGEAALNATYAPKESAVTVVRDGDDVTLYDSNGVEL